MNFLLSLPYEWGPSVSLLVLIGFKFALGWCWKTIVDVVT